jgi:hypothetical protein
LTTRAIHPATIGRPPQLEQATSPHASIADR